MGDRIALRSKVNRIEKYVFAGLLVACGCLAWVLYVLVVAFGS